MKESKLEKRFAELLDELEIEYLREYELNGKPYGLPGLIRRYDFQIGGVLLIEVHGEYWHFAKHVIDGVHPAAGRRKQRKNVINDDFKRRLAEKWNFDLMTVWEREFENPEALKHRVVEAISNARQFRSGVAGP